VDPEALAARANFGTKRLDSDLLHVVRNAPADWQFYRDALPYPGYPWRYVREAVHRAGDRGVVETRKNGNKIELRRKWPYPEWVERIVAVENKPDLDASAADALADQQSGTSRCHSPTRCGWRPRATASASSARSSRRCP